MSPGQTERSSNVRLLRTGSAQQGYRAKEGLRAALVAMASGLLIFCCVPTGLAAQESAHAISRGTTATRSDSLPPSKERELESYLKDHGLTDILVTNLEDQLQNALGEDRIPIAERLSLLYSKMMDEATDEAERKDIETRSMALLKMVPNADTEQLRLNIEKASYLRAERTAEMYRIRAVDDASRTDALRIMTEVADGLSKGFDEFHSRSSRLANMDVGNDPSRAAKVSQQLANLDSLTMQAAYYGAWADYYKSFLSNSQQGLDDALSKFSYVFQSDRSFVSLEDLSDAQFSYEETARSGIGIALCLAREAKIDAAMDWLKRLEDDQQLNEKVRPLLPGYTFVVYADGGKWNDLSDMATRMHNEGTLTQVQTRLVAVLGLEHANTNDDAQKIAEKAIAWMSETGDLKQVIEVADAFDFDNLHSDTFVVSYVLAIKADEKAQTAHGSEQPTTDPKICAQYDEADKMLQTLVERKDASRWPDAVHHALLMQAWCSYYTSQFTEATKRFTEVSKQLSGDEAESALWMAIVCQDRLGQDDRAISKPTPDQQKLAQAHSTEIRTLMQDFIKRFPSSRRAGQVRYRLATTNATSGNTTDDLMARVNTLLAIPSDSNIYHASQIEAERLLYQVFRDAPMVDRPAIGQKYLAVALPLMEEDQRKALIGPASTAPTSKGQNSSSSSTDDTSKTPDDPKERYIVRARRILDVQLTRGIARLSDARTILDRLERASTAGLIDLSGIQTELAYRRFQLSMLSGQFDDAIAKCEAIWKSTVENKSATPKTSGGGENTGDYNVFALAACREIYQYAVQDWQSFPTDPNVGKTLQRVIGYGKRSLLPYGDPPKSKDPAVLIVMVNVVEAAEQLGQSNDWKEADLKKLFETWSDALYAQEPNNYRIIRAQANKDELDGQTDKAVDLWRLAVNKLDEQKIDWFEAKYNFIRLLSKSDTKLAQEVMAQLKLLHPDYGPEPWGSKLRALDQRIGPFQGNPNSASNSGSGQSEGGH